MIIVLMMLTRTTELVSASIQMQEIGLRVSVADALRVFGREEFVVLLDSAAAPRRQDCRYTFLTADPVATCRLNSCEYGDQPFEALRDWQQRIVPFDCSEFPPFIGGIAGLMSYELGQAFERLPQVPANEFTTPALMAGLFDWAIVWDRLESTVCSYVIQVEFDSGDPSVRQQKRTAWVRERLDRLCSDKTKLSADHEPELGELLPGHDYVSSCSDMEYVRTVQRVINFIAAGDIFQANLSQQLTASWDGSAIDLYLRLCESNSAPFCGFLHTSDFSILSASPERFLKVERGGQVETRPIKGTRRRQQSPIADLYTADELSASEKDRAENVMIVDLLRNDISRVCRTGSVKVTGVCEIEVFETVQHLVSTIEGELREDCDVWDLCVACFPGGSITGAPKIRAMEIIAELEQVSRGAYCGSLFYCGPLGDFDSSILIRTFTLRDGRVCFPVGGGIVADSVPRDEYEETLHKASGMLAALRS